jgi:hypothetical protein
MILADLQGYSILQMSPNSLHEATDQVYSVTPTEVENQPTIQPEPGWLLSRD